MRLNKKILQANGYVRVEEIKNIFGQVDTVIWFNPKTTKIIAWQKHFGYYEVDRPHLVEKYTNIYNN